MRNRFGMCKLWSYGLQLSLISSVPSRADVTDFTWSPSPICVGQLVTYTAVNNGSKPLVWHLIGVGETFYTFTQHMELAWTDPCGRARYSYLGSIKLARKKVSATEWQLIPNPD